MCGIVGGIGKADFRTYVLEGLKKLNYRGYDSAGISYAIDGEWHLYRTLGSVEALEAKVPAFEGASIALGHTRWATHGEPSEANAHPQTSGHGLVRLVHNGVIENFRALKTRLRGKGYVFASKTDTEVIADLLEYHYEKGGKKDFLSAIRKAMDELEGSYACGILLQGEDRLYFMKNASPLLIGLGEGANYLASDCVPMMGRCEKFLDVEDGEYGYLEADSFRICKDNHDAEPHYVTRNAEDFTYDMQGYPHFMLKEIEEIPHMIGRLIDNYFEDGDYLFDPGMIKDLKRSDEVIFIACGTSYHASLLGCQYMRYLGKRATAYIASEWAYHPYVKAKRPFFIFLSQSGETADIIACQKIVNRQGFVNVAVTNVQGSTLARKATYSCLVYAGLEVAVAATKSYVGQACFLALLEGAATESRSPITHVDQVSVAIKDLISRKEEIHELAKGVKDADSLFYIGRGDDYYAALESALKLKEISYIHAEAYPGGELKHGPIALIEKGTPVVGFISEAATAKPLRNNMEELKTRGAVAYIVSSASLSTKGDAFVIKDVKPYMAPILKAVFGQYFAYYVALEKGLPIDKPRNLAKSVTVE